MIVVEGDKKSVEVFLNYSYAFLTITPLTAVHYWMKKVLFTHGRLFLSGKSKTICSASDKRRNGSTFFSFSPLSNRVLMGFRILFSETVPGFLHCWTVFEEHNNISEGGRCRVPLSLMLRHMGFSKVHHVLSGGWSF